MQRSEVEKIMNSFYDNLGQVEPNWLIDTAMRKALLEYEPEKAADVPTVEAIPKADYEARQRKYWR